MSTSISQTNPQLFLDSLREYVVEPIDTATSILEREERELLTEQEALEAFGETVRTVTPATRSPQSLVEQSGNRPSAIETVRDAFIETLFGVDHYERAYDESVLEGIGEEFGWDFAAALQPNSGVEFSATVKDALLSAVDQAIEKRKSFRKRVRSEKRSVDALRREIDEILNTLDSSVVPAWFEDEMKDHIESLLDRRQQVLNKPTRPFDSHEFRSYLYQDAPWTYPVLTAIARLRESVTFE